MVIDINLDDGLLDGMAAMQKFCKIAVTEPDVSKVRHDEDMRPSVFLGNSTHRRTYLNHARRMPVPSYHR